jgi:hypothetical protein
MYIKRNRIGRYESLLFEETTSNIVYDHHVQQKLGTPHILDREFHRVEKMR